MTDYPKFTIVTPSFNQGAYIRQTIESVKLQNYPNLEHIVVDGGSTDQTISILREYPHLQWTSEPDRGQSHAINKGFQRATGEILTWINSDDWLAPGALHDVARSIGERDVIMGGVQATDEHGSPLEVQENVSRNWFDLLKYWIYFSSPAQPGVFVRRSALERVKLRNGDFVDEGLYFAMDLDLWLRLGIQSRMDSRVPRILSFARFHSDAKTQQDGDLMYKEMSRVFRRHSSAFSLPDRGITQLFLVDHDLARVSEFLQGLSDSMQKEVEVLVVDYSNDRGISRRISRSVLDLAKLHKSLSIRHLRSPHLSLHGALNHGIENAGACLVSTDLGSEKVSIEHLPSALELFRQDSVGAVLASNEVYSAGVRVLALQDLIEAGRHKVKRFCVRKTAWIDSGSALNSITERSLEGKFFARLASMRQKGWLVSKASTNWFAEGVSSLNERSVDAEIVIAAYQATVENEFAKLRLKSGFSEPIPEELYQSARADRER